MTAVTQVGNAPARVAITIPDNTGTGSTIRALLVAAGYQGPDPIAVIIDAKQPGSSTDRAAIVIASPRQGAAIATADFTTHGQYRSAGVEHYLPSDRDANSSVRSADASAVSALAIVLF